MRAAQRALFRLLARSRARPWVYGNTAHLCGERPDLHAERASARETTARVAAGGVAKALLSALGVEIWSFTAEVGGVAVDPGSCTRSREES
ncbi:MAG: chorismate synthase, partial [Candidatus Limnocylindrus sp.]